MIFIIIDSGQDPMALDTKLYHLPSIDSIVLNIALL